MMFCRIAGMDDKRELGVVEGCIIDKGKAIPSFMYSLEPSMSTFC